MKERACFTFDKTTIESIYKLINGGKYRNKSHVFESAIKLLAATELNDPEDENFKEEE